VALVALVNALAWGLVIPPYHVPDETAHSYYVQYVAETGELPRVSGDANWFSDDLNQVLTDQLFPLVIGTAETRVPNDERTRALVARHERQDLDQVGVGDAASAANNPPLYYVAQLPAYYATRAADPLDRLALMRVVSALMSALTVLCIFLFLRELLPGTPLVWTVGALVAALQPTFGFVGSGVNNDAGLYLAAAAFFLGVARIFRHGLTPGNAVLAALPVALGVMTKTQMAAFVPALALALLLGVRRAPAVPWRALGAGAVAFALPLVILGGLMLTVWDRPPLDRVQDVTTAANPNAKPWQLREQLSFGWQLFLPRMPWMNDLLPDVGFTAIWLDGLTGYFGWLDYKFPDFVYPIARAIWLIVAVAAGVHLWQRRAVLPRRFGELAVYATATAGLAAVIAIAAYRYRVDGNGPFEQARYLLPLLCLYAAIVGLAVRAAGRWAPVAGVLLVAGAAGHSLFAQFQTLARYFG
jgi:hypothetical protein